MLERTWNFNPHYRADTNELLAILEQYFGVENQGISINATLKQHVLQAQSQQNVLIQSHTFNSYYAWQYILCVLANQLMPSSFPAKGRFSYHSFLGLLLTEWNMFFSCLVIKLPSTPFACLEICIRLTCLLHHFHLVHGWGSTPNLLHSHAESQGFLFPFWHHPFLWGWFVFLLLLYT